MFVPGANIMISAYNDIYYRKILKNYEIAKKTTYAAIFGILFVALPIFLAIAAITQGKLEPLRNIIFPYMFPFVIDYFILRCQCKHLNIPPEEIGPNFYKFLLLKKKDKPTSAPPQDDTPEASSENTKDQP